jgi:hypothetical protein
MSAARSVTAALLSLASPMQAAARTRRSRSPHASDSQRPPASAGRYDSPDTPPPGQSAGGAAAAALAGWALAAAAAAAARLDV